MDGTDARPPAPMIWMISHMRTNCWGNVWRTVHNGMAAGYTQPLAAVVAIASLATSALRTCSANTIISLSIPCTWRN